MHIRIHGRASARTGVAFVGIALLLAGCGFHLRRAASLPPGMQRVHLQVSGGGALQRELSRSLEAAGTQVVDDAGEGVAELSIPTARFSTNALTISGADRVREYAVHYQVELAATDAGGQPLIARQSIDLSREFTYDSSQALGTATAQEEIQRSLVQDMVQAILRRLEAASARPVPAAAASATIQLP